MRFPRLLPILVALVLAHPFSARAQREKFTPDDLDLIEQSWPQAQKTNTGIRYVVEREGHGRCPVSGDLVSVLYAGRLLRTGVAFDKSRDRDHPFTFRIARGIVIRGWDQFIQLMHPGEKCLVIIPQELAYGSRGSPPHIPRDAPLVFEIELLSVQHDGL